MARESRGDKARRQIRDLNAAGLSNAEIARQMGVNRSQITRYKKGETSPRKGGKGRNLTLLWKRTQKTIGKGGVVNLTSFFRRVWVKDYEPILPLAIEPLPTYSWPRNAPVSIQANFKDWIVVITEEDGTEIEQNRPDQILSSNFMEADQFQPNTTGEALLQKELEAYIARHGSYLRLKRAVMSDVLIRWGSND